MREKRAAEVAREKLLAQRDLMAFVRHVREGYQANWHHSEICKALMAWVDGSGPERLMLFMPASNGKSELVSRCLPAYILGRQKCNIIACSHTQTLANEMSTDVREIMRSEPYRNLFGQKLGDAGSVEAWRTLDGSKYHCAGVGGPVTGKHFHFGIIDDPVKNAEEAFSEVMREKTWQWYTRVFRTRRIGGKARMLLTSTRWHEDDLAGRILANEAGRWKILEFKAIDEKDARRKPDSLGALWPERYDRAFLDEEKHLNPYAFEALYQQQPVAEGGGMFKRVWFKYAEKNGSADLLKFNEEWRNIQDGQRYLTVDLAASTKTTGDYTVIAAWSSFSNGHLVLLDVLRERLEGPDIIPQIQHQVNKHRAGTVWIEKIGFQAALIQDAFRRGLPVRELYPDKDKVTRAAPAAALFSAGRVWFAPGGWHLPAERELCAFPAGEHDDIVDAIAYGVRVHNAGLANPARQLR